MVWKGGVIIGTKLICGDCNNSLVLLETNIGEFSYITGYNQADAIFEVKTNYCTYCGSCNRVISSSEPVLTSLNEDFNNFIKFLLNDPQVILHLPTQIKEDYI